MFVDRRVSGLFAVGAGALLLGEVHAVGGTSFGRRKVHLAEEALEAGVENDDDHVPIWPELIAVTPLAILLAEFLGEALQLAFGCLDSRLGVTPRLLGARLDVVVQHTLRLSQNLFGFGPSLWATRQLLTEPPGQPAYEGHVSYQYRDPQAAADAMRKCWGQPVRLPAIGRNLLSAIGSPSAGFLHLTG